MDGLTLIEQWFPSLSMYVNHLQGLLQYKLLDLKSKVAGSVAGPQEFAFLLSPKVILMLLVRGPYFENHCCWKRTDSWKMGQAGSGVSFIQEAISGGPLHPQTGP